MNEGVSQATWTMNCIFKYSKTFFKFVVKKVKVADCRQNPSRGLPILHWLRNKIQRVSIIPKRLFEFALLRQGVTFRAELANLTM